MDRSPLNDHSMRVVECNGLQVTPKQMEAIGNLNAIVENLQIEGRLKHSGLVLFAGDAQDGPCLGYIRPDGSIIWEVEA